jgi:hypothetical protein
VDAADEGVDQAVDHPLAELAGHEWPDGPVADGAAHVGPGEQRVARQAQLAAQPDDAGSGGGPESGGDAQRQATGQRAHPPAGPHPRSAPGDRDQGVSQADLPAQVGGLGPAPEEPVRSGVHRAAAELLAVQCTPEPGRRLDDGDVDPALTFRPAGQLPGRRQAADAATDHHHPAHGRLSPRPPRR